LAHLKLAKVSTVDSTPPRDLEASRRTRSRKGALAAVVIPVAALLLGGCDVPAFWAKPGVTKTAKSTFHLWQGFTVAALIIGGFVILLIVYAVLRYRRRGDAIPRQTQYHIPLEMAYTIVPIIIVFALFAATVVVENEVTANPPANFTVNVFAFQWGWKFQYPGTNALTFGQTTQAPYFEIPVNQDVRINLNSLDVVHGFYIPEFNFSRYAQPGVNNVFTFHPVQTGIFFGQCSQLCGLYHTLMWFRVKVVPLDQYETWIASFNTPAGAAAAEAAAIASVQQLNPKVPTKPSNSTGTR
jgi:cytochrome c oxidase subunit 2